MAPCLPSTGPWRCSWASPDRIARVNITLPRRVLYRLDQRARAAGETRSGFIARLTLG